MEDRGQQRPLSAGTSQGHPERGTPNGDAGGGQPDETLTCMGGREPFPGLPSLTEGGRGGRRAKASRLKAEVNHECCATPGPPSPGLGLYINSQLPVYELSLHAVTLALFGAAA